MSLLSVHLFPSPLIFHTSHLISSDLTFHVLVLEKGIPARKVELTEDEWREFRAFGLLTAKPSFYCCNVSVRWREESKKRG